MFEGTCGEVGITHDDDPKYIRTLPSGCDICKGSHPAAWCPSLWVLSNQCPQDTYSRVQENIIALAARKAQTTQEPLRLSDIDHEWGGISNTSDASRVLLGVIGSRPGLTQFQLAADGLTAVHFVHFDLEVGEFPEHVTFMSQLIGARSRPVRNAMNNTGLCRVA